MKGGAFEAGSFGGGKAEVFERVIEGELNVRCVRVAFEMEFEVGKIDALQRKTRELWWSARRGSGSRHRGRWKKGGQETRQLSGGGAEVQTIQGDLANDTAVAQGVLPAHHGEASQSGKRFLRSDLLEGQVSDANLVGSDVELGKSRLKLRQQMLQSAFGIGGALMPEMPCGHGKQTTREDSESEEANEDFFPAPPASRRRLRSVRR